MMMRPATQTDVDFLYHLRNEMTVRLMSREHASIPFNDHLSWFEVRVKQPGLWIATDENGSYVGTIRIDGDTVSYAVVPKERGKGYATLMLKWAKVHYGELRAVIRQENLPSLRAAEKAGHRVVFLSSDNDPSLEQPQSPAT